METAFKIVELYKFHGDHKKVLVDPKKEVLEKVDVTIDT